MNDTIAEYCGRSPVEQLSGDEIGPCWSTLQKIHIICSIPVHYWIFLQASPYSLYLLLKTMITADLSASEIVSFFAHIFRLKQGRVSMLFSHEKTI